MKFFWIFAMILGFVSSQSTIAGSSSSESDSASNSDSSSSSSESGEIEIIEIEGSGVSLETLQLSNFGILPGPGDNRKKRQLPSAFDIRK
ncbi:unnamed protein product [Caenorhabditis angaria]|uniref:Secreted protein n=1 Tax=Caenorhabditis angaria TaxID=860376 RepID=A0A9P1MY21_9PELO|nr:unnamed protein product [Caenorhabditis angaria]